jgi:mitochondrial-processing peptidase subunit alpha
MEKVIVNPYYVSVLYHLPPMRSAATSLARHGARRIPKGIVNNRTATTAAQAPPVQITTLPNKIRVATEATPGHFSSVGLYVDAGSRYETPEISGTTHFLDRMAFKVRFRPVSSSNLLTDNH